MDELQAACRAARQAVEASRAVVVFGHGDLKPANALLRGGQPTAPRFIDLELAGPTYRGYDLAKLFRRDVLQQHCQHQQQHQQQQQQSADSSACASDEPSPALRRFAAEYASHAIGSGGSGGGAEGGERLAALLLREAHFFEPVSWLEAALVFQFAWTHTQSDDALWQLAVHRW
ncbi:MAG: phosphotransferase, partial [Chloroflexota bacterium]